MEETEWRRRWKKTLKCCAWQNINIDGGGGSPSLFVKYLFDEDRYEILFSDLTNTWFEQLNRENIDRRNKEINPTVEVPVAKLLNHLEEVLKERNQGTSFTLESNPKGMNLAASFKFVGLPFSWKFCGKSVDVQVSHEHFTIPMMTMISHLAYQRDQLIRLLKNKDKEILDLKSQGIQTSRKNLETKIFDETSFVNEMISSDEFEHQVKNGGKNAFNDREQKLYSATMMKANWLEDHAKFNLGEITTNEPTFDGSVNQTVPPGDGNSWASNRVPTSLLAPASNATPDTSPSKSPSKQANAKDIELLRRQELEARLAEREEKDQKKKKKKLKF